MFKSKQFLNKQFSARQFLSIRKIIGWLTGAIRIKPSINDLYTILIGNNNVLEINGIKNPLIGHYINNAIVTATLSTLSDVPVTGQTWPINATYIPNTDGCYNAELPPALNLFHDKSYKLHIRAAGNGLIADWQVILTAKIRRK